MIQKRSAFTIIELLIVISIISTLAVVAISNKSINSGSNKIKISQSLKSFVLYEKLFKAKNGTYYIGPLTRDKDLIINNDNSFSFKDNSPFSYTIALDDSCIATDEFIVTLYDNNSKINASLSSCSTFKTQEVLFF